VNTDGSQKSGPTLVPPCLHNNRIFADVIVHVRRELNSLVLIAALFHLA